jgi:membrane-bound serine protease (ClpP class)
MLGLALIVAEILFPSLGILGVGAAVAIIAAISVAFAKDNALGVNFLIATALAVPLTLWLGVKLIPLSPLRRVLVNEGATFQDAAAVDLRDRALLGREGVLESLCRPAGTAYFEGRRVDVVSRGESIEAGARVRVIEVEGNRVVVATLEAPSSAGTS